MNLFGLGAAALATLIIFLASPAQAAGWSIQKNEPDPFDPSKSIFVAQTMSEDGILFIRCLQGSISLLVAVGPSNALVGDDAGLKIVANSKVVQEENAQVLTTNNFATAVQFGDDDTLEYLNGAQKISLRYTLGGATFTVSFSGGKSLADVIAKTRKACGLIQGGAPKSSVQSELPAPATTAGAERDTEPCKAEFGRLKSSGDLGPNPNESGFIAWCKNQSTAAGDTPKPSTQSCAVFDQIQRDLPSAANSTFEAQHLMNLRVTSVDLVGPAAPPNSRDCLIDVGTNIGVRLKLRYHLDASGRVTVANTNE